MDQPLQTWYVVKELGFLASLIGRTFLTANLFANHLVRMVVIAYLSTFASAHKNSELLNVSMLHQIASQKSWVSLEAINARNLILVSLALSAVLLDLTFKSSLPRSMCASTQWEHSSLLLSHNVFLKLVLRYYLAMLYQEHCTMDH